MNRTVYENYVGELGRLFIKEEDKVFDCGCGDGFHTSILHKYSSNVIGGDFNNRTREKYRINFRKFKVNRFGNRDEFDVVTSFDVIEHVEDDNSYLRELIRITKKGGLMIIGTPNRDRLSNKILSLVSGTVKYPRRVGYDYKSGGELFHLREYTQEDLKNLVKEVGGAVVDKIYCSFLGLYVPKITVVGFESLDLKFFKNYCQHLFIVLKKI